MPAEAAPCTGRRRDGGPCGYPPRLGDELCARHRRRLDAVELGRRLLGDPEPARVLDALADLLDRP